MCDARLRKNIGVTLQSVWNGNFTRLRHQIVTLDTILNHCHTPSVQSIAVRSLSILLSKFLDVSSDRIAAGFPVKFSRHLFCMSTYKPTNV